MKKLTTAKGVFGPYLEVQTLPTHHLCDGAMLHFTTIGGAGVVSNWTDPLPFPPVDRVALARQIDAAVRAIYAAPMSFSKEYEQREAAANAYKAAGYAGAVPARVAGFATPAGMAAQAAADLILSQAAQLRGALDTLSDLRMRKYEVLRAASDEQALALAHEVLAAIAAVGAAIA